MLLSRNRPIQFQYSYFPFVTGGMPCLGGRKGGGARAESYLAVVGWPLNRLRSGLSRRRRATGGKPEGEKGKEREKRKKRAGEGSSRGSSLEGVVNGPGEITSDASTSPSQNCHVSFTTAHTSLFSERRNLGRGGGGWINGRGVRSGPGHCQGPGQSRSTTVLCTVGGPGPGLGKREAAAGKAGARQEERATNVRVAAGG